MINVADVLDDEDFIQDVILKVVTTTSVDFVESDSVVRSDITAVVQPADMDKINADNIDWSLEYLMIHTKSNVVEGNYIQYNGADYKIISRKGYGDYGYNELLGEETKRELL